MIILVFNSVIDYYYQNDEINKPQPQNKICSIVIFDALKDIQNCLCQVINTISPIRLFEFFLIIVTEILFIFILTCILLKPFVKPNGPCWRIERAVSDYRRKRFDDDIIDFV